MVNYRFGIRFLSLLFSVAVLCGCDSIKEWLAEKKDPVFGERISIAKTNPQRISVDEKKELGNKVLPNGDVIGNPDSKLSLFSANSFSTARLGGIGNLAFNWPKTKLKSIFTIDTRGCHGISPGTLPVLSDPGSGVQSINVLDSVGVLRSYHADTGKLIWKNDFFSKLHTIKLDRPYTTGGLLVDGNVLFVTAGVKHVGAFDLGTGKILWMTKLADMASSVPLVLGDKLIVQSAGGVYALSKSGGSMIWKYFSADVSKPQSIVVSTPVKVDRGNNTEIAIQAAQGLVIVNSETGEESWKMSELGFRFGIYTESMAISYSPVYEESLHMLFVLTTDGKLIAIQTNKQRVVWEVYLNARTPIWVGGDLIYLVNSASQLIAVNKLSGKIQFIRNLEDKSGRLRWSVPVLAGNKVVITRSDGTILCYDPLTGEFLNKYSVIRSADLPIFTNTEKSMYVFSRDGTLVKYS